MKLSHRKLNYQNTTTNKYQFTMIRLSNMWT